VKKFDVTPSWTAQIGAIKETWKEPTIIRFRQYPCPSCHQPNSKVKFMMRNASFSLYDGR
jgi:hypothetical protein